MSNININLVGSAKQIKWAASIKTGFITKFNSIIVRLQNNIGRKLFSYSLTVIEQKHIQALKQTIEDLNNENNAEFWINRKNYSATDFLAVWSIKAIADKSLANEVNKIFA